LWRRGSRAVETRDLLAVTFDRFTEGFEAADVANARRLLESWA
jgi:hypothetical protein